MHDPTLKKPAAKRPPFITVEMGAEYAVLSLAGQFDSCACQLFRARLEGVRESGIDRVVLDLDRVRFVNSRALACIVAGAKAAAASGGQLVLARPSAFCRNIIRKIGLERLVSVFDTNESAIAHLRMGSTRA